TVTETVDAVWVAFSDELAQLTFNGPPTAPAMDDYELFYDCCSRLTKFIEKNMDTTPGFLEQMDRLIFACHYGAPGSAVRFAMTKDLRIRRGKANNGKEHVSIKTDHLIAGVRGDYYSWNGIEAVDEEKTVDDEPFTTKTASVEKSETIVGFGFGTG
ncbi:hypothetical protein F442_13846, partial [Phytophthora nicotianae P10297]